MAWKEYVRSYLHVHILIAAVSQYFLFLLHRDENLGLKMGAANSTSEPHPEMEPGLVEKEGLEPPGDVELRPMAQEVSSKTMQLDMYSYLVCVVFVHPMRSLQTV